MDKIERNQAQIRASGQDVEEYFVKKTYEEIEELAAVLSEAHHNSRTNKVIRRKLKSEITDLKVCLEHLERIFELTTAEMGVERDYKLDRGFEENKGGIKIEKVFRS